MTDTVRTRFEMGRVIGNTFEVLGRNFVPFILVALALGGIPAFILQLFSATTRMVGVWAPFSTLPFTLIRLVLSLILQGTLVTGAISSLNGNRIDLGAMLSRGASAALPLLGLAIVEGFGLAIGFVLLIIPGLILLTLWSVAVPALVIERTGVLGAFNRSADLTRGRRWPVFGLLVLYAVLAWIVGGAGGALVMTFSGGLSAIASGGAPSIPMAVWTGLVGALFGALSASGAAALYYELRLTKEGVAPQAVFDTFS